MEKKREQWGSKLGFIMAAAGSAIGLGTLWMFPFVTGENGGGAFVLVYLLCTVFIGIPTFMAELILGRRAQRGAVGIFSKLAGSDSSWKAVGWMGVASSFFILSYYSVVAGWGLNYIFMSFFQFYRDRSPAEIAGVFETLTQSGDISIFWHALFMLISCSIVYRGVRNGIEYWSTVMTSGLLILLLALLGYSMTLDGFSEALHFVFYPDLSKLKPSSVLEALGLSFFTLSVGQGIMLTYGSYMKSSSDIPQMGIIIGAMDIIVSVLAALMIFPIIFTFGFPTAGGPGLVFKTLPVIFAKLPGALIISTTFFTMFAFTALTSAVAFVEVAAANLIDLFGWSRKKAVIFVGIGIFILGIPCALSGTNSLFADWKTIYNKNFFDTLSSLVSNWILPLGAMFTSIFIGWKLNKEHVKESFAEGSVYPHLFEAWFFLIRWIVPVGIALIILYKTGIFDFDAFLSSSNK